jgi:hypothetical protein
MGTTQDAKIAELIDRLFKANDRIMELQSTVIELNQKVAELQSQVNTTEKTSNGRGGSSKAVHILDTKTRKVYRTKSSCGLAVAPEYGLSTLGKNGKVNTFVWYEVLKQKGAPERFKEIDVDTYNKLAEEQAKNSESKQEQQVPAMTGKGK